MIKKLKIEFSILGILLLGIFIFNNFDIRLHKIINDFSNSLNNIYFKEFFINITKLGDSIWYFLILLILFVFSPTAYFYVSITQNDKRTDYPGRKISQIVQEKWDYNFSNSIDLVGGDEWHGGNLSYHLNSRPKWDNIFESKKSNKLTNDTDGFVLIGEAEILSKICNGIFLEVEKQGICMLGTKR